MGHGRARVIDLLTLAVISLDCLIPVCHTNSITFSMCEDMQKLGV